MTLTLPGEVQRRVAQELSQRFLFVGLTGKVVLSLTLNVHEAKVGSFEIECHTREVTKL